MSEGSGSGWLSRVSAIFICIAMLAAALPPAVARAQGVQAGLYVVDGDSRRMYVLDLIQALRDGHGDAAIKWQGQLTDGAGRPMAARPLGVAVVWDAYVFVSFDDGTLNRYTTQPGGLAAGVSPRALTIRLPRVATRLGVVMNPDAAYLAYAADRDPASNGQVYLLHPGTLAEKGAVPLGDLARGPAGETAPGGPGTRRAAAHTYAIAGLGFVGGTGALAALTADPQAVMVLDPTPALDGADPARGGQVGRENPLPLGAGGDGAALATASLPSGEELFVIRAGRRVEVKMATTAFAARSFMTELIPPTKWVQKYGDGFALQWAAGDRVTRNIFSILCFSPGFPGSETTFFVRPDWVEEEAARQIGRSFPFWSGPVTQVEPEVLTPPVALGLLPAAWRQGSVQLPLYRLGEPVPPDAAWTLPFAPRGCQRIDTARDPAATVMPAHVDGRMSITPYFGTDAATGGRYVGNFWLRPVPGSAAFTLPAAIGSPQDIDVVIQGEAVPVAGTVRTADRSGRAVPLPEVTVQATVAPGGHTVRTYADEQGRFRLGIPALAGGTVAVRAALRDRAGIVAVRSPQGYSGGEVWLQTRPLPLAGGPVRPDLTFVPGWAAADPGMTATQRAVLRDAAVFYHDLATAVRFARQTLGVEFDHRLPVEVDLHSPTAGVFYAPADSRINVPSAGGDSAYNAGDGPDNREYHEFGHHLHTDAALGGEDTLPVLAQGDTNHGGADNSNSSDALVEGFAEYFALLVKGSANYRWAGAVTNLERNYHEVAPGKPDEEFNVAALLWDLTDPAGEAGDRVQIPVQDLWRTIQKPGVTTVRTLYEVLRAAYGSAKTDAADRLGDLDRLFVAHRFFSDANRNGNWDAGEAVGYADYYQSRAAQPGGSPRPDRPPITGTLLEVSQADETGRPVVAPRYRVRVFFADSQYDYSYDTGPTDPGRLRVLVPTDSRRAEIAPLVPGYAADTLALTPDVFWPAVAAAQARGSDVFMTHAFRLVGNGIPAPTDVVAQALAGGQMRLTWRLPAGVDAAVLVRGLAEAPPAPDQGTEVFRGTDTAFTDQPPPDLPVAYTLFAVRGEATSPGVSVVPAPAAAAAPGGGTPGRTMALTIDRADALIDGRTVALEVAPTILNGRTLVPLRFVAEALDAEVAYDAATRGITVILGARRLELWLDQTRARVDGAERALEVPPLVRSGRSLVPLRFVAEALGAQVEWDPETRTVTIRR